MMTCIEWSFSVAESNWNRKGSCKYHNGWKHKFWSFWNIDHFENTQTHKHTNTQTQTHLCTCISTCTSIAKRQLAHSITLNHTQSELNFNTNLNNDQSPTVKNYPSFDGRNQHVKFSKSKNDTTFDGDKSQKKTTTKHCLGHHTHTLHTHTNTHQHTSFIHLHSSIITV
jgi:hypothetical protein